MLLSVPDGELHNAHKQEGSEPHRWLVHVGDEAIAFWHARGLILVDFDARNTVLSRLQNSIL